MRRCEGVRCTTCGRPVEEARRCFAVPVCYSCFPPPPRIPGRPLADAADVRSLDVASVAVSALSAGLSLGVVLGRTSAVEVRERVVEVTVPAAPRKVPEAVELREGVPGSALQPVVPADLYVQRMAALRERCVSAGNSFGLSAVEEGVSGECWDPRRDERAWAEWVGVHAP